MKNDLPGNRPEESMASAAVPRVAPQPTEERAPWNVVRKCQRCGSWRPARNAAGLCVPCASAAAKE